MSKNKVNVHLEGEELEGAEVKITISDEDKENIPRVGDEIHVISPYPVDEEDDEFTIKEKPIQGYGFASVMVKSTVLTDDLEEVLVNGDYRLPLRKKNVDNNRKLIVCVSEQEAKEKFDALSDVSIERAKGYFKRFKEIIDYLEEAKEKVHH